MSVSLVLLLICYPHKQTDKATTKITANPIPMPGTGGGGPGFSGDGGEEVAAVEKSRTDKLIRRKLSGGRQGSFNNGGGESGIMDCVGSDGEAELRHGSNGTINRFKLPKKLLDECSTVCRASVPRKLRSSAMKKRRSESISPTPRVSNKLNRVAAGDDQSLENDGFMKSKLKMKQVTSEGCVTNCIQDAITEDEQEVAEALYALSGVFPKNIATIVKTNLAEGGMKAKSSPLTKAEIVVPPVDGRREELETVNCWDGKSPSTAGFAGETARVHCQKPTTESDCSIVEPPPEKLDTDMPQVNLHLTAFISEKQQAICDSASGAWTQLKKTRSKSSTLEKREANYKSKEIVLPQPPIADVCDKTGVQPAKTKTGTDGSPLRPELSSTTSCDSQKMGVPFQSTNKLSAQTESTSVAAQSPPLESNFIAKKSAPFSTRSKKPWKRCSTHVYISSFIKAFQGRGVNNNRMMMQFSTMNELPDQKARRTNIDQSGEGNSLIAKNATEVKNAILLHKKLVKDQQQQASKAYDIYNAQNPSLGFLSMAAGAGGGLVDSISGIHRTGNSLETSTSVRIPFLQSQNQAYMPFPGPQNLYSSTTSSGLCPVAPGLQVQLPPYFGSRSYAPPFTDANAMSVQPLERQNCNRPPLMMTNFESVVLPSKQTGGGPDIPPFLQPALTSFPHSLSSLEVLGSRYSPILQQQPQQQQQQQQQLFPSSTAKGPYHHLPSVYDANVSRVKPDNASLQIICNQYI